MKMLYAHPGHLWLWRTELIEVPGTGMNCPTELTEFPGTGEIQVGIKVQGLEERVRLEMADSIEIGWHALTGPKSQRQSVVDLRAIDNNHRRDIS